MLSNNNVRIDHVLSMAGDGTRDFNCWGASQYVLHARDTLKWVEVQEMSEWLTTNTKTVKHAEVGDVLVLIGQTPPFGCRGLIHTAVYLGHNQYLHKLGQMRAERASKAKVLAHYRHNSYEIRRLTCV